MSVLDAAVGQNGTRETRTVSVAICVATKNRPTELAQLLDSIADLQTPGIEVAVYLADNDPVGGAQSTVEAFRSRSSIPVELDREAIPGYAAVRNCSLRMVPTSVDWVAFIDDDELASPGWISALLATADRTGARLVGGPVIPLVGRALPQWRIDLGTVGHPGMADGVEIEAGYTGNLLVGRDLLSDTSFNLRFGATGGEDSDLTLRLRAAGERIVYSPAARVYTPVLPADLATDRLVERVCLDTANYTRVMCWQHGSLPPRIVVRSVLRLGHSLGLWAVGTALRCERRAAIGKFRAARSVSVLRSGLLEGEPPARRTELAT